MIILSTDTEMNMDCYRNLQTFLSDAMLSVKSIVGKVLKNG